MVNPRRCGRETSRWATIFVAALLLVMPYPDAATANPPATAQATHDEIRFTRFVEHGDLGGRLETADVSFENVHGVQVRLVSAVHIGEKAYYEELNKSFTSEDVVLYEMVQPKGSPPPRLGETSDSSVARFQRFLKDTLGLDYQLDVIDYRAPNFVHADMDLETFESMSKARGESFATIMLRQMLDALANPPAADPNQPGDLQTIVNLLTLPDTQTQLKLLIARQLDQMERIAAGLDGPEGSVILTERNKKVFSVFEHELNEGKMRIAIFYGAAHMPDLAARLQAIGFKPLRTRWHLAWDMTIRADRPSAVEQLMNQAKKQSEAQ